MIIAVGEMLVEFVSHTTGCGLTKLSTFSGPYPSGAPVIFANQAARVGAKSAIIGSVGADPFGDMLTARLSHDGVDMRFVGKSISHTTGSAFVSYFEDGSRTFVFHMNGTAADQIENIPTLERGSILHISGASLGNQKLRSVIMELVEQARTGCKISYDPNMRPELMKDSSIQSCIDYIIDASDFLLPSGTDLEALFPAVSPETFIKDMLSRGKSAVVVKQGAKGAIGSCGAGIDYVESVQVEEIDPTGAGDCFCGTFIGLIDQGYTFTQALSAANVAGAMHVSKRGPMQWNPSLQEIKSFSEIESI